MKKFKFTMIAVFLMVVIVLFTGCDFFLTGGSVEIKNTFDYGIIASVWTEGNPSQRLENFKDIAPGESYTWSFDDDVTVSWHWGISINPVGSTTGSIKLVSEEHHVIEAK